MIDGGGIPGRDRPAKIFLAAGEVSGDRQAAYLAEAILREQPETCLFGAGGEGMSAAGVDVRIQTSHLGCIGFQESLRFIGPLRRVSFALRAMVHAERPDLAILVDHEWFNMPLARRLFADGVPFIYYFPPQVSIWGKWRAKIVSKRARAIIPAFAADAEIYERAGGRVHWFGHPFVDIVKPGVNASEVMFRHGLNPARRTIAIMPGSRLQEVETLAGPMVEAARLMKRRHPELQIILPVAAPHVLPTLEREVRRAEMSGEITFVSNDVYTLLSKCSVVIVASGTATLEVALLGVPMVIGYRVQPVTYHIIKRIINTRFVGTPNIMLGKSVLPELLQSEATAERFAAEALAVLDDPAHDRAVRAELGKIRGMLGRPEVLRRTASFVLGEATRAPRSVEALV